jgi:hypothetical protein
LPLPHVTISGITCWSACTAGLVPGLGSSATSLSDVQSNPALWIVSKIYGPFTRSSGGGVGGCGRGPGPMMSACPASVIMTGNENAVADAAARNTAAPITFLKEAIPT